MEQGTPQVELAERGCFQNDVANVKLLPKFDSNYHCFSRGWWAETEREQGSDVQKGQVSLLVYVIITYIKHTVLCVTQSVMCKRVLFMSCTVYVM